MADCWRRLPWQAKYCTAIFLVLLAASLLAPRPPNPPPPPYDWRLAPEERAAVPSPRTPWSVFSAEQQTRWESFQSKLAGEAAAFRAGRGRTRLVLLGDSITEAWRGTSYGNPSERTAGVPAVLHQTLGKQFDASPLVLAISGDQTQHLLWRLQRGGELSAEVAADRSVVFVVMIGTNNLGHGHLPGEAADGVLAVARHLLSNAAGAVVLSTVLPRGDGGAVLPKLCPPRCNASGLPFRSFLPAVSKLNARLDKEAATLSDAYPGRFRLATCGAPFLATAAEAPEEVKLSLMPDRLHPGAEGSRILAECFAAAIRSLLDLRRG